MVGLLLSIVLSQAGSFQGGFVGDELIARVMGRIADRVALRMAAAQAKSGEASGDADSDSDSDSSDDDAELEVLPPVPPVPPIAPVAPAPPRRIHIGGKRGFSMDIDADDNAVLPRFSETGKNVPTAEILHRIAQRAGWSMTLVGAPRDRIDIDVKDVDPREALRDVLKKSGAMGVLKGDKLVVLATPGASNAGTLIEEVDSRRSLRRGELRGAVKGKRRSGRDVVAVFQGDLTIQEGQIVQGDVVCVGGSVELEPGSVVQGDAVAVGGSVSVKQGALVLGEAVSVLGNVEIERGGQVMGKPVQVGLGRLFARRSHSHRAWLTGLGPFGLFPTIALFAVIYLIGLVVLRMWPERVRNVGFALFENPVRSFTVGFLCWLLLLPLIVLLAISIVGIPLIPLLPVIIFLSIVMGLSSFALRIGEALPAGPGQRFVPPAALGMGMAVLLLVAFVPWLGISILALLQFFALGASVGSRFGRALPPHAA